MADLAYRTHPLSFISYSFSGIYTWWSQKSDQTKRFCPNIKYLCPSDYDNHAVWPHICVCARDPKSHQTRSSTREREGGHYWKCPSRGICSRKRAQFVPPIFHCDDAYNYQIRKTKIAKLDMERGHMTHNFHEKTIWRIQTFWPSFYVNPTFTYSNNNPESKPVIIHLGLLSEHDIKVVIILH